MPDTPDIKDMVLGNGFTVSKDKNGICYSSHAYAKPATAADLEKDAEGITNPNLHRRIDEDLPIGGTDVSPITLMESFIGNGHKTIFNLETDETIDSITYVTLNGEYAENYTVSADNRTVTFSSAPGNNIGVVIFYVVMRPNVEPDKHSLFLSGTNAYRHTTQHIHNENSAISEIP